MNLTYRGDVSRNLTAEEVDANFRTLAQAVGDMDDLGNLVISGISLVDGQLVFQLASGATYSVPLPAPSGGSGIAHGPSDGKIRGSKNGDWIEIPASVTEAASDGKARGRKNGAWVVVVEDAPSDGVARARQDGAWVAVPSSGGGGGGSTSRLEAPAWYAPTVYEKGDLVEHLETVWVCAINHGSGQAPSLLADYWMPVTLGSPQLTEPVTQRLYHNDQGVLRTVDEMFAAIIQRLDDANIPA